MERTILMSAPMVRSLLAGTKTQTRRVCKSQPYANGFHFDGHDFQCHNDYLPPSAMLMDCRRGGIDYTTSDHEGWAAECPYGQPGDRLWVREAFQADPPIDSTWASTAWHGCPEHAQLSEIPERYRLPKHCIYRADWTGGELARWRPSIHMPRWASRITLEITEVRVQRLQEISEADAIAEGCRPEPGVLGDDDIMVYHASHLLKCAMPVARFVVLWESINGPGSWDANPWVWAISFKRLTP